MYLAQELNKLGAKLTLCDSKPDTVQRIAREFNATVVDKDAIFDVDCDVFAPCARGGVLTEQVVARLKAPIIAGAANNQLAHPSVAASIHKRNIIYAPDYVINAGGLIQVSLDEERQIMDKVNGIYDALLKIFTRSQSDNQPSSVVADSIAQEIIAGAG